MKRRWVAFVSGIGWWRPVLSILCLALVALWLRDWRHSQPYNDGTWARVQQTGVLRVGMDASYPPFSDTPAGVPVGLDVDIANEIGRRLHLRVEIINMGFDSLYDSLQTNQADALISALSIDPAQMARVMYTTGYIDAGQVLVSRDGQLGRMEDLEGRTLAVEYGSLGDETARLWQRRLHLLNLSHFTTASDAMQAVIDGQADAALVDFVTARLYGRAHPGLVINPNPVVHDIYAVAVRLPSYDLGGAINDALKDMLRDGTLTAILDRWL
jgi:ABC-type amino acid transport substrate-binding protein